MTKLSAVTVAGLLAVSASAAKAAIVSVNYEASVYEANAELPVGSIVSGQFSYDTTIPGVVVPNPTGALAGYWALTSYSVTFNGTVHDHVFPMIIGVAYDTLSLDQFLIQPNGPGDAGAVWSKLHLIDTSHTALSSVDLPLSLELSDWDVAWIRVATESGEAMAAITSLTSSSAPEPGTWALMILGFGMVAQMVRHNPSRTARSEGRHFRPVDLGREAGPPLPGPKSGDQVLSRPAVLTPRARNRA